MAVTELTERETEGRPEERTSERTEAPQAPRFRRMLLAVLAAVVAVGLVSLAWLVSTRGVDTVGVLGDQQQLQAEREAVMAQSEQFMLRMGTYGPDLLDSHGAMPQYRARVKEVITPKFAVSFDKEAATAEQLVAQAHISREADVFAAGVSAIDADSATALVAGAFTDSYPEQGARDPSPFRIEVRLVKVDGHWLVDDFSPVTGEDR
jgi:hypothetical protein